MLMLEAVHSWRCIYRVLLAMDAVADPLALKLRLLLNSKGEVIEGACLVTGMAYLNSSLPVGTLQHFP